MRRRFVVATGSPAASEFGRYCLLLVFRESLRLDDVSGATSFELVATLRFEVATGSSREKRCVVLSCDWIPSCWFRMRRRWSKLLRRRFGEPADVRASGYTALSSPCWDRSHHEPSVAHYHTVNTSRGHCTLSMILGAMFEFLSSLVGRAFHCSLASHA
ncbi:hypothetical protein F511_31972 [Dorcoceras hygrometricum]|uniref:Uncharacterized protein n=1 Tax=Dorcoceras hygrometricum TaxID=472368 RepID=A0A2Z7B0J2_9LAMI|nr:hypothetical protein F511_31972 [Dorcoceras hygrometricum]